MPERQLTGIGGNVGTRKTFTDADLIDNQELTSHAFIPVITKQGTPTRHYFHGFGADDAETRVGRLGFDLQVADDDAGTNAAAAKGTARPAVYPDDNFDVPVAVGDEYTLDELRDWQSNSEREKELFPAMKPGAFQERYLVWEVKIDSSQEGKIVYQEGSAGKVHYTERKINQRS
jgi:hypothetical protein